MKVLIPVEYAGQRVLTTQHLSDSYGADRQQISKNFTRNQSRYIEGKHYIMLHGEEKRQFLNRVQIDDGSKNATALYLWTEKGAWLHAKSLNTDHAWEAYETLVDDYYRIKTAQIDVNQLSPELQMFKQIWDGLAKAQMEQAEIKQLVQEANANSRQAQATVTVIKDTLLQRDEDWRKAIDKMIKTAAFRAGGNYQELRSESYKILEERGHCDLRRRVRFLKERLEEGGATKSKLNSVGRMDVIESDPRLREIYTTIVKELTIETIS